MYLGVLRRQGGIPRQNPTTNVVDIGPFWNSRSDLSMYVRCPSFNISTAILACFPQLALIRCDLLLSYHQSTKTTDLTDDSTNLNR